MPSPHFTPEFFGFLLELRANNNREWFKANKARYESSVKDPLLQFIADFGPHLRSISAAFVADPRPVGGSMFRIYRDTRFSKDKTPYKTAAAVHFRHGAGKDVHAPGFYLHLAPGEVFVGGGLWRAPNPALKLIRDRMVDTPDEWTSVSGLFSEDRESLKRVPRGFDKAHPFATDLKRKSFVCSSEFDESDVLEADFMERVAAAYRSFSPAVEFLTRSLGVAY